LFNIRCITAPPMPPVAPHTAMILVMSHTIVHLLLENINIQWNTRPQLDARGLRTLCYFVILFHKLQITRWRAIAKRSFLSNSVSPRITEKCRVGSTSLVDLLTHSLHWEAQEVDIAGHNLRTLCGSAPLACSPGL
jgi:hypothetical protein